MVDYSEFNELPHLYFPVIYDIIDAKGMLLWLEVEIRKRQRLFAEIRSSSLESYNEHCKECNYEPFPTVFAVLDDFGELIRCEDIKDRINTVLAHGRPAGVHCVLVTSVALTDTKKISRMISSRRKIHNMYLFCRLLFRPEGLTLHNQNLSPQLHNQYPHVQKKDTCAYDGYLKCLL